MYNYYYGPVNLPNVIELWVFTICTHHLPLYRAFHPTSAQFPPRLSVSFDQATAPYSNQDSDSITWWCQLIWIGGLGGGGWRGLQKPSCHLGGWWQVSWTTLRADSCGRTFSEHLPLSFWPSPPISSSSSEQSICTQIPLMQWNISQMRSQGLFFCLIPLPNYL